MNKMKRPSLVISTAEVGVAIFVAIVGSPATPVERVAAFQRGWWVMAPIAALGLIPTFFLIRPGRK